jgi:hypothetical protein
MSNQVQNHVDAEVFTEYSFGFLILFVRLAGRTVLFGSGSLAWDDLCTLIAMFFWTAELVILFYMGAHGNSIGLTEEDSLLLDEATKNDYRMGDKLNFASWYAYIVLIWSMKGIIIFNYHRLTRRLWQNKLNRGIGWASLACFTFCVVFQFSNCTPIQRAWRVVPVAGDKCTFRSLNYIIFTPLSIL